MEASTAALGVLSGLVTPTAQIVGGTTLSGGVTQTVPPLASRQGQSNINTAKTPPITYHRLSPLQVRQRVSPI